LENIGVFLGAGASSGDVGGWKVDRIWEEFSKTHGASFTWLKANKFIADTPPNVEILANTLEVARQEWDRAEHQDRKALAKASSDLKRAVVSGALLRTAWWDGTQRPDAQVPELLRHRELLQKLCGSRAPGQPSPWVFTPNYDLAVEWAAESLGLHVTNGFDGVHERRFLPHGFDLALRNTLARGEARFGTYSIRLAKLHGSLTWKLRADGTLVEESAPSAWPSISRFLNGEAESASRLVVFPNVSKYAHTVGFVLGELMRRFAESLSAPQSALLIVGYSFSDEHINRILLSALQNPTLQVVLYVASAKRDGEALTITKPNVWLNSLLGLASPRVTIVGGRPEGYLPGLVSHLPDPVLFDEQAAKIREMLRQFAAPSSDAFRHGGE
jgi:hypothetical protein